MIRHIADITILTLSSTMTFPTRDDHLNDTVSCSHATCTLVAHHYVHLQHSTRISQHLSLSTPARCTPRNIYQLSSSDCEVLYLIATRRRMLQCPASHNTFKFVMHVSPIASPMPFASGARGRPGRAGSPRGNGRQDQLWIALQHSYRVHSSSAPGIGALARKPQEVSHFLKMA